MNLKSNTLYFKQIYTVQSLFFLRSAVVQIRFMAVKIKSKPLTFQLEFLCVFTFKWDGFVVW